MKPDGTGSEETEWSSISRLLQASTESSLKFASLQVYINAGHVSRKEILDAVLYLVSSNLFSSI